MCYLNIEVYNTKLLLIMADFKGLEGHQLPLCGVSMNDAYTIPQIVWVSEDSFYGVNFPYQ